MLRRIWFPVLLGVTGVAVLLALGAWQLRRMEWKNAILAEIDARILAEPVEVPASPEIGPGCASPQPGRDCYLPVVVSGALGGQEARVLVSLPGEGPGYRVVSALTAGDRRLLVDLGFVPEAEAGTARMAERVTITGNLHWPDETDSFTPAPDEGRGIWFARDVPAMAASLGTEPVLVVARSVDGADLGTVALPVDSAGIPNDHWEYAVTWFSLAAVWALMSAALARRSLGRVA